MFFLHCKCDMLLQGGIYLHYHNGDAPFTKKQLCKAVHVLKTDAENVQEALQLDRAVFEKLKIKGIKTIKEAVLSGSYGNAPYSFDAFEDHLAYWGLRRRVPFLLARRLENMVKRDYTMYFLFKEKLMTDWPDMLDLSPNDQVTLQTAEQMKEYYKLLCVNEAYYL